MGIYLRRKKTGQELGYTLRSLLCLSILSQGNQAIAIESPSQSVNSQPISPQHLQHLSQRQQLETNLHLRLPDEWPRALQSQIENHAIENHAPPQFSLESTADRLGLQFSTCSSADHCWTASLLTESLTPAAQAKLEHYENSGYPITLTPDISGFLQLIPSTSTLSPLASVIWVQDEQLFTVELPEAQRQTALYLAHGMASSPNSFDEAGLMSQLNSGRFFAITPSGEAQPIEANLEPPTINALEVSSNVRFANEIRAIAQPYIGAPLDTPTLTQLAAEISQQYQTQGYLTSGAIVNSALLAENTDTSLTIGPETTAAIIIREDRITLEDVAVTDVDGNPLDDNVSKFLRARLGRALHDDEPIQFDQLEDQLRLLREDPLFSDLEASLTSLSTDINGRSRLSLRATQAQPFQLGLQVDNGSPVSTGGEQGTVTMAQNSLFRFGDRLHSSYSRSSTGGLERASFGYQMPLNALNGTLSFGVDSSKSKVTQAPFDRLGVQGNSRQYSAQYRQPLIRSIDEEFALSFGFTHTTGQTFLFNNLAQPFGIGPDLDGRSRVSALSFGQHYLSRDERGAWLLNSEAKLGLNLLGATRNVGNVPDGQFVSWLGQVQRSQKVGENHWLVMQADAQLTPQSLLPSEQFVIGGAGSVRGYRQNLRSGDSGFRISVEDRITLSRDAAGRPNLYVTPFLEVGNVWRSDNNPNPLPNQSFLVGTGIGLLWNNAFKLPDFKLRLDYGVPLTSISDRGDSLQDSGIHFSLGYEL